MSDVTPVGAMALWAPHVRPAGCEGCPRNAPNKSIGFVPGWGPYAAAKLFVLGEQPGTHEVQEGRPFIHKSGEWLDAAVRSRDDLYVSNVRKCLGIGDETATEREESIAHCIKAYLAKEFEAAVAAHTIVAVGADALQVLTGLHNIVKFHGSTWTRKEVEAMKDVAERETPPWVAFDGLNDAGEAETASDDV